MKKAFKNALPGNDGIGTIALPVISTNSKRQEVVHFEMDGQDIEIKFVNPGFDLAFVKTVFGVQGDTTDKIIVDLNKNPNGGHTLSFEAFYVLLSRVRLGCNIRVVPWNQCHGKTHLLNLHHDSITDDFLACFDEITGLFNSRKAKAIKDKRNKEEAPKRGRRQKRGRVDETDQQ